MKTSETVSSLLQLLCRSQRGTGTRKRLTSAPVGQGGVRLFAVFSPVIPFGRGIRVEITYSSCAA